MPGHPLRFFWINIFFGDIDKIKAGVRYRRGKIRVSGMFSILGNMMRGQDLLWFKELFDTYWRINQSCKMLARNARLFKKCFGPASLDTGKLKATAFLHKQALSMLKYKAPYWLLKANKKAFINKAFIMKGLTKFIWSDPFKTVVMQNFRQFVDWMKLSRFKYESSTLGFQLKDIFTNTPKVMNGRLWGERSLTPKQMSHLLGRRAYMFMALLWELLFNCSVIRKEYYLTSNFGIIVDFSFEGIEVSIPGLSFNLKIPSRVNLVRPAWLSREKGIRPAMVPKEGLKKLNFAHTTNETTLVDIMKYLDGTVAPGRKWKFSNSDVQMFNSWGLKVAKKKLSDVLKSGSKP